MDILFYSCAAVLTSSVGALFGATLHDWIGPKRAMLPTVRRNGTLRHPVRPFTPDEPRFERAW